MAVRLSPDEYKALTRIVFSRDGWRCIVCKSRCHLHAHHIIFRSDGGEDVSWNLATVCNSCHDAIHRCKIKFSPLEDGQRIDADLKTYKIYVKKGKIWLLVR